MVNLIKLFLLPNLLLLVTLGILPQLYPRGFNFNNAHTELNTSVIIRIEVEVNQVNFVTKELVYDWIVHV